MTALLDVVKTRQALPTAESGPLPAGSLGTVVLVYETPRRAYEVEFLDDAGATIALLTLEDGQLQAA